MEAANMVSAPITVRVPMATYQLMCLQNRRLGWATTPPDLNADGTVNFHLEAHVYKGLLAVALPGETPQATITRLLWEDRRAAAAARKGRA